MVGEVQSEKYSVSLVTATFVDGKRFRGPVPSDSRVQYEFNLGQTDALCSETAEVDGKSCTLKAAYATGGKLYCIYECPETEPKDPDPPKRPGAP